MVTIALDTSLDVRVAVCDGADVLATRGFEDPRAHVEQLTLLLGEAFEEAGRPQITRVVVGIGPGPFTGLRVGIAAAQVLAFLHGAELVSVCSLDVLAKQVPCDGEFSVVTDARRGEWYHARYAAGERIGDPAVSVPDVVPGPHVGPVVEGAGHVGHLDPVVLATGDFPVMPPQALYLRDPDAKVPTRRKSALVPGLVLPAGGTR